jgi:hypothetical protein
MQVNKRGLLNCTKIPCLLERHIAAKQYNSTKRGF